MLNDRYVNWGRNLKHKFKIVEPKSLNDLKKYLKRKKNLFFVEVEDLLEIKL